MDPRIHTIGETRLIFMDFRENRGSLRAQGLIRDPLSADEIAAAKRRGEERLAAEQAAETNDRSRCTQGQISDGMKVAIGMIGIWAVLKLLSQKRTTDSREA